MSTDSVRTHAAAFLTLLLAGLSVVVLVAWDRRPPLVIHSVVAVPSRAESGSEILIKKSVTWRRRCLGEVYRQIVGPDKEVRVFTRETVGVPWHLGTEIEVGRVSISPAVAAGTAYYRSVIVFRNCGFTSRWWTIDVLSPEVEFEVAPGPHAGAGGRRLAVGAPGPGRPWQRKVPAGAPGGDGP